MTLDEKIHGISTLILKNFQGKQTQSTGFYYAEFTEDSNGEKEGPGQDWEKVENLWLVTNRHVVLHNTGKGESLVNTLTFHLRKQTEESVIWEPVIIEQQELASQIKVHPDSRVDVAVIDILDLVRNKYATNEDYMQWWAVTKDDLPGQSKILTEVTSEVITVSYPLGYYDEKNVFPIVKQGIIASRWGKHFNGTPHFLIDVKLFPGSSGSIVISKPTDFIIEDGKPFYAREKQFDFLGVFSGEPFQEGVPQEFDDFTIIRKQSFNLGIVWYAELVEEIIHKGASLVRKEKD